MNLDVCVYVYSLVLVFGGGGVFSSCFFPLFGGGGGRGWDGEWRGDEGIGWDWMIWDDLMRMQVTYVPYFITRFV